MYEMQRNMNAGEQAVYETLGRRESKQRPNCKKQEKVELLNNFQWKQSNKQLKGKLCGILKDQDTHLLHNQKMGRVCVR